jgi:hypothetical protein
MHSSHRNNHTPDRDRGGGGGSVRGVGEEKGNRRNSFDERSLASPSSRRAETSPLVQSTPHPSFGNGEGLSQLHDGLTAGGEGGGGGGGRARSKSGEETTHSEVRV